MALDSRIILIKNSQNKGTALSRNLGIEKANGAFIAFLDSDDQWLPYKLKTQVEFMQKYNLEMTFSSYFLLRDKEDLKVGEPGLKSTTTSKTSPYITRTSFAWACSPA